MASTPMRSFMLLARAALQRLLDSSTPGFTFLREFFAAWLKLDVTTIAAGLTIFGTITGAFRDLQGLAMKMYWWFTKFFTAAISIASNDRLNKEILNWIGTQILERQGTRILTAKSEIIETDAWRRHWNTETERNDYYHEKRAPIEYLPTFGTTWFIHSRSLFMVRRVSTTRPISNVPEEYSAAPEGDEPLVVMCLGRSVEPIKRFFETCRSFADEQREAYITVRASKAKYNRESWDTTILRPIRPLPTVHFDEDLKMELIADITNYLEPSTRRFYNQRGIPYRRGYLLHGPPGTGKTSLSLALAGHFGLELYLLHLPGVREDSELERLFTALPPRCIVLLEDIDAVGMSRQRDMANNDNEDEDIEENEDDNARRKASRCTLSGLLNVIDGVASQEGRVVLMTSNMAHKLDAALVRPGRIDRMIFLGNISQRSCELMFLRMFTPDEEMSTLLDPNISLQEGELEKLALEFGRGIPEETFTPAQLQGYLLNRRTNPREATRYIGAWAEEEQIKMAEAKVRAKEGAERRAKKRREAARRALMLSVKDSDLHAGNGPDILEAIENETIKLKMKNGEASGGKDVAGENDLETKLEENEAAKEERGDAQQIVAATELDKEIDVAVSSEEVSELPKQADVEEEDKNAPSP